jgi:hypothetical protein
MCGGNDRGRPRTGSLRRARQVIVVPIQVSEAEIRRAQKAEREQEKIKKTMKARMDFLDFD